MKGDGDGKAREDEVGGVEQGEAETLAGAEAAGDEDAGGLERVLADPDHDEAGDEKGRGDGDRGNQSDVGPAREIEGSAHPMRSAPALSRAGEGGPPPCSALTPLPSPQP